MPKRRTEPTPQDMEMAREILVEAIAISRSRSADDGIFVVATALAEQRERDAVIAEDYDHYKTECLAPEHHPGFCAYCESINDGGGYIATAIRKGGV